MLSQAMGETSIEMQGIEGIKNMDSVIVICYLMGRIWDAKYVLKGICINWDAEAGNGRDENVNERYPNHEDYRSHDRHHYLNESIWRTEDRSEGIYMYIKIQNIRLL